MYQQVVLDGNCCRNLADAKQYSIQVDVHDVRLLIATCHVIVQAECRWYLLPLVGM